MPESQINQLKHIVCLFNIRRQVSCMKPQNPNTEPKTGYNDGDRRHPMPRFSFAHPALKAVPGQTAGAWRIWNLFKTLSVQDITEAAERPFHLALIY